ncbi:hypothetical protein IZY60_07695 [Lutibacter sp. B2]|nr:hypothetical protein [Lutibacter sp. B2]
MRPKDINFIISIVTLVIFILVFYIFGSYVIKPKNKKIKNRIIIFIILSNISIIFASWYFLDLYMLYRGIINGFGGSIIGIMGVKTKDGIASQKNG